MASVEELNKAIEIIRSHCKTKSKTVNGCDDCVLGEFCEACWDVPCYWENVEEDKNNG